MIIDTNANLSLATIPAEVSNLANSNIDLVIEESVLCIDSRAVFFDGSELLKSIKTRQKTLEAHRVEVTKPLRGVIDTINGWFKSVTEPLETAEASLKRKLAVFEKAEMERQQAEQARLDAIARREREELEARAEKAADKGNLEQAQALARRGAEVMAARADVAPVKIAGASFGEKWLFEVIDAGMVPREYLMVDEKKIGQVVRALKGDTTIPGVRVFKDFKVSVRA